MNYSTFPLLKNASKKQRDTLLPPFLKKGIFLKKYKFLYLRIEETTQFA